MPGNVGSRLRAVVIECQELASDLLGGHGIELPLLAEPTQAALRELLPPTASTANPSYWSRRYGSRSSQRR